MPHEQHIAWLREKLTAYQTELAKAEEVLSRVRPLIDHLQEVIKAFETEQHDETPSSTAGPGLAHPASAEVGESPPADAQTRSRMPPRRSEYQHMTAVTALTRILESQPRSWHADEVVHALFDVRSREQFDAGKRAVVSELIRACNRGLAGKLGGNRFVAKSLDPQEENSHSLALPLTTTSVQEPCSDSPHNTAALSNGDSHSRSSDAHAQANVTRQGSLKPGTRKHDCYTVLEERGTFMTASDIYDALLQKGRSFPGRSRAEWIDILALSMRASISHHEGIFIKQGTGVFGLAKREQYAEQIELTRNGESDTLQ